MMYRALVLFTDSRDNNHRYYPGDEFPREGLEVSDARIAELASANNARGVPVIEAVPGKAATASVQEDIKEPMAGDEEPQPKVAPKRRKRRAD
jgi:hypothetical protein